jgi:hypothetical protein
MVVHTYAGGISRRILVQDGSGKKKKKNKKMTHKTPERITQAIKSRRTGSSGTAPA